MDHLVSFCVDFILLYMYMCKYADIRRMAHGQKQDY